MNPNQDSLYSFMKGTVAGNYVNPTEKGFPTQGSIGSILNIPVNTPNPLKQITDGLYINRLNKTDNSSNMINNIHPMKDDWSLINHDDIPTPLHYCQNGITQSQLLPYYPSNNKNLQKPVPNNVVGPNCDLTMNGSGSPTLYGASTFGLVSPEPLQNTCNDIGHELDTFGIANEHGSRALSQGKFSKNNLRTGLNVPNLRNYTHDNVYTPQPVTFNNNVPLYQVGDWTDPKLSPYSFIQDFRQNLKC